MRVVIQRAKEASVTIDGEVHSQIGPGLMVLACVEEGDTVGEMEWIAEKLVKLRIFDDEDGVMNRSVMDVDGDILIVSQFTLVASTRKGNRPSYIRAGKGPDAVGLYEAFVARVGSLAGKEIRTGVFGADMKVSLVNDGPVTIIVDSRLKE